MVHNRLDCPADDGTPPSACQDNFVLPMSVQILVADSIAELQHRHCQRVHDHDPCNRRSSGSAIGFALHSGLPSHIFPVVVQSNFPQEDRLVPHVGFETFSGNFFVVGRPPT